MDALVRRAAELEMPALALTDQASLSGMVELIEAGRRHGVKPIIGCDLSLAEDRPSPHDPRRPSEITLLAATDGGLRNLVALVNLAQARAAQNLPAQATLADLEDRRDGLLALVGGPRSALRALVAAGDAAAIESHLTALVGCLGREALHIEIVDRDQSALDEVNRRLVQIADFLGLPAVATNDVWYLEPSHALAHDFLRGAPCDPARWVAAHRRNPKTEHFASPSEMRDRFTHRPHLLENGLRLAERCTAAIDLTRRRFPHQDFTRGVDANSALWDLVFRQAPERLGPLTEAIKERLNTELDHITNEGLANCVLILWRLAAALDAGGILRGVGHGRLITSLVAYVLGLTEVNPLLHGLPFSGLRERDQTWPVLGLEVPTRALTTAHAALAEICGRSKVALMGAPTHWHRGKLRRELCVWAGIPASQISKVIAAWPRRTVSPEEAQRAWPPNDARSPASASPRAPLPRAVLAHLAQTIHPRRGPIEPLAHQVLLSPEHLHQLVPLAPADAPVGSPSQPRAAALSHTWDLPVCQLDAASVDRLGLLRLEIRTPPVMDILDHATTWVRREEAAEFHPAKIPFDDHDTWALIGRGQTTGIPALRRISTKSDLRARQPRSLAELIEILAARAEPPEPGAKPPLPAIGDAILALRCAYLRTHHPVSFLAALLTHHHSDRRQLRVLLREATAMGIRLLAPDINTSQFEFSQEGGAIRAGLVCVRGMTPEAYAAIARARLGGAFQDLQDLWERVDHRAVPLALLGNLVKGGVLDSLGDRARMLALAARIGRGGWRPAAPPGLALDLFEAPTPPDGAEAETVDAATLARYERQVLGTILTEDPLRPHADLIRRTRAVPPTAIQTAEEGAELTVVGFLDHGERASLLRGGEVDHILDLEGQVVLVPREVFAHLSETLLQGDPVLVCGVVGRRGHERHLRAQCVVPLAKVERVAQAVAAIGLSLAGENRRTLKLLIALCAQCPGATAIEILSRPSRVSGRLCRRLEQMRVYYAPPLSLGLRKILPEEAITLRTRPLSELGEAVPGS